MNRIDELALQMSKWKPPWWLWPAGLASLGVITLTLALVFAPGPNESVLLLGETQVFGKCGFLEATGKPCPSCGMTRSWVHSARGNLFTGFGYSPAGALLFWWLVLGGVLGGARLALRDANKWAIPHLAIAGGAIFWMVGPYFGTWVARLMGLHPLP